MERAAARVLSGRGICWFKKEMRCFPSKCAFCERQDMKPALFRYALCGWLLCPKLTVIFPSTLRYKHDFEIVRDRPHMTRTKHENLLRVRTRWSITISGGLLAAQSFMDFFWSVIVSIKGCLTGWDPVRAVCVCASQPSSPSGWTAVKPSALHQPSSASQLSTYSRFTAVTWAEVST